MLFGTEKGAWNWKGYDNLSCLTKVAQKHQNKAGHLKATVTMRTFGDTRIDPQLDEQRRRETTMHNKKNDLISAVAEVMGETIKEEINKTPFLALILDETSDVSKAAQLSCSSVCNSGVKERFVKFEDVTGKKRKDALKDLFEHHEELMMLPFSVLMATFQTWATLNLSFSLQLLTKYLRMQMCSSTSYRI
ncbi:hypothetical protein F7725_022594, partial [Dissostichus mawsoni]